MSEDHSIHETPIAQLLGSEPSEVSNHTPKQGTHTHRQALHGPCTQSQHYVVISRSLCYYSISNTIHLTIIRVSYTVVTLTNDAEILGALKKTHNATSTRIHCYSREKSVCDPSLHRHSSLQVAIGSHRAHRHTHTQR